MRRGRRQENSGVETDFVREEGTEPPGLHQKIRWGKLEKPL